MQTKGIVTQSRIRQKTNAKGMQVQVATTVLSSKTSHTTAEEEEGGKGPLDARFL